MRQSPPAKGKNRGKPSSTGSPSPESVVADGFMRMDVRQAKHEMAQTGEGPHPQGLPLAELVAAQTSSALGRLWLRRSAEERQRWGEAAAKCQTGQKRYRDGFHLFSASLRERRSFHEQRDIRPLRTLIPPPGPAELTTRFHWLVSAAGCARPAKWQPALGRTSATILARA